MLSSLFITKSIWLITLQYVTPELAFNSDDFDRKNRDGEKPSFPFMEDFRRQTGLVTDAHEVLRVALRDFLDWKDSNLTLYINKMRNQREPFYDEFDQIIPYYKKVFRFISEQVDEVRLGNYAVTQFYKDRYDLCSVARYLSNQKRYPNRQEIVGRMGKALGQDCDPCIPYRRKEHEKRDVSDRPENQHPILRRRRSSMPCPKTSQRTAVSITTSTPPKIESTVTTTAASTIRSATSVLPGTVSFPDLNWQSDKEGRLKWAYNCDFFGSDITVIPTNNKKECRDKCYNNLNCTHFSWNGFDCYLKHFENKPTADNLDRFNCGWISGRVTQPKVIYTPKPDFKWKDEIGGIKWANACLFEGPDDLILETIYNRQADLCRADCVALPNCTKFNLDGGKCELTQFASSVPAFNFDGSTCGSIDHMLPGTVSFPDLNWQSDKGGRLKWAYNCEFYGSDIITIPSNNNEDCTNKCDNNPECTHFAWNGFSCFLKHYENNPTAKNFNRLNCGWISDRISESEITYTPKPDFKWNEDTGGMKWAQACQYNRRPQNSILETLFNKPADFCRAKCVALPNCTNFNWEDGECDLIHLKDSSVQVYNFDGTTCGSIYRITPPESTVTTTAASTTASFVFSDRNWRDGSFDDKWDLNCHFKENDLSSVSGVQSYECGRNCYNEPQCTHYTYAANHFGVLNTCYLKRSTVGWTEIYEPGYVCGFIPGRSTQYVGTVTTTVASTTKSANSVLPGTVSFPDLDWQSDQGGRLKWAYNCDFFGSDITKIPSNKKEECRDKCYNNPNCTHFSWNGLDCYLKLFENKPTAGNLDRFNCGWISGRVTQPEVVYTPKPDFKWKDEIGGKKWANACLFYGPDDLILETIHNRPADLCRADCVALPNCTKFNLDGGKCELTQFASSVPAYNFDGSICGSIDRS